MIPETIKTNWYRKPIKFLRESPGILIKLSYPVCYVTTPEDEYWCFVPDLGLFDQGRTMDELHKYLKESSQYAIDSELEEGHPIPRPSKLTDDEIPKELQDILDDPNNKELHLGLFCIDYDVKDMEGGDRSGN